MTTWLEIRIVSPAWWNMPIGPALGEGASKAQHESEAILSFLWKFCLSKRSRHALCISSEIIKVEGERSLFRSPGHRGDPRILLAVSGIDKGTIIRSPETKTIHTSGLFLQVK